jgi:hypothetical protein
MSNISIFISALWYISFAAFNISITTDYHSKGIIMSEGEAYIDASLFLHFIEKPVKYGDEVIFAVDNWGTGAVERLGLSARNKIKVVCNLAAGQSDPSEIRKLIDLGADVYASDILYTRIVLLPASDISIVGSIDFSSPMIKQHADINSQYIGKSVYTDDPRVLSKLEFYLADLIEEHAYKINSDSDILKWADKAWELRTEYENGLAKINIPKH